MFFLLSENDSEEICFSFLPETKKEYNFSLWRNKSLFSLESFVFLVFVLWEKNSSRICSFIHDLKRWSVKQPIWILGILEGNREALFFIIPICENFVIV